MKNIIKQVEGEKREEADNLKHEKLKVEEELRCAIKDKKNMPKSTKEL